MARLSSRPAAPLLTQRALNRALLERQSLSRRSSMSPTELVEHLVGLQAQAPNPPYVGVWTRLEHFHRETLTALIERKDVVRATLMRGTLHLFTSRDFLKWRGALQAVLERLHKGGHGKRLEGLDLQQIAAIGREWLDEKPLTVAELGPLMAERWPGRELQSLTNTVRNLLPLIHLPPAGTWDSHKAPAFATPERYFGRSLEPAQAPDALVLRYLEAFGPASLKDIQAWSGFTGVREVIERLRPQLRTFHDENGQELFDPLDAPLPDPEMPVPVRFLPEFDNVLLSYADRTRILSEEDKARVFTVNGIVRSTILVDGFVRGLWRIEREREAATLRITPFARLSKQVKTELEEEGERLLSFVAGDSDAGEIVFERVA